MSTIPGTGRRRPARTACAVALALSVAAAVLATAPPSTAGADHTRRDDPGARASGTQDLVLRPDGDVPRFAVTRGTSAAAVLDDVVRAPRPSPGTDAIRAAVSGSSTAVVLAGRMRPGLQPSAVRARFLAVVQGSTSLRVEAVSRDGVVLAATVLRPGRGARWGSLGFRPSSRAALTGLALRFTAVGGNQAEVRAAYADVTARSGRGTTLRPRADVGALAVRPAGTASAALDDEVRAPAAASYAEHLRAGAAGRSTTIRLADAPEAAGRPDRVQAWVHARTGAGTRLRVEAVVGGRVRATTTIAASSPAAWRSFAVPVAEPDDVADLQLRLISVGGGDADVAAAHLVMTVTGGDTEPFRAYLDRYATTLSPLKAEPVPPPTLGDPVTSESEPMPDVDAPSGQSRFQCTTTPVTARANPEKIVTLDPDGGKLWLGALLQGHRYAEGPGSLADLPTAGERAPIKIWTDLMGADVTREVADPDGAEVHQAIADMVRTAQEAGVPAPARLAYSETSQSSVEDGLIKAGVSVTYVGGGASGELTSQRKAQRSSLLVSLTQRAYTVNLVRPDRFSDYFDDRFTRADLEAMQAAGQIGPDKAPVVVSNIAYGRVLYYSLSSTASQSDLQLAVKASYQAGATGGSGEVSARHQAILDQAEVKVFAIGGNTSGVEDLIRTHKMQDYFAAENSLDRAVPISYQVDNLDGSAATFTETIDYQLRECQAIPNSTIDVGDVVRISKPQFYLDANRDHADMFGSLSVDGTEFWNRTYDRYQTIRNHTVTDPTSADPAVDHRVQWPLEVTLEEEGDATSQITGSVNCRLWWPESGQGSNQYRWTYDVRSHQPGPVVVHGGSRTCGTQLRFQVSKVRDVVEYQP